MPRFGCSESSPVRERPPSQYMPISPPRSRIDVRGDERLLVAVAAAHREDAAVRVDALHRPREQLRLRHEAHLPPDGRADEEVVHEREVVRGDDHRAARGTFSASMPRARKNVHAYSDVSMRTTS